MSRAAAAVAGVLAAAAAVATWCWLGGEPAPMVPPPSAPSPAVAPPTAAPPATADLGKKPEAAPKPAAEGARVKYPDGSSMPALNGVTADVVVVWGKGPFTRIVGTEDGPGGWKWYVHENGARSTTVMLETNGVARPTPIVAEPQTALPPLPDAGNPPGTGKK